MSKKPSKKNKFFLNKNNIPYLKNSVDTFKKKSEFISRINAKQVPLYYWGIIGVALTVYVLLMTGIL